MAKDLLLEIGMEEIPARFVRAAGEQLYEKLMKWVEGAKLSYDTAQMYATPRRLAVVIKGLQEKQEDTQVEVKGPSRKIAQDDEGNWTKAALGFARSQQVEPEALFFKEIRGVEYVHVLKKSIGLHTGAVAPASARRDHPVDELPEKYALG